MKFEEIMKNNGYGIALKRNDFVELKVCVSNLIEKFTNLIDNLNKFDEDDREVIESFKNNIEILKQYKGVI